MEWIDVQKQMPPPDKWLLVAWGIGDFMDVAIAHTFSKWKHPLNPLCYLITGHPGSHNDVKFWMLLPAPPGGKTMNQEQTAAQRVDAALESVLRAAGMSLKHCTMPSSLDRMRETMRKIMLEEWAEGTKEAFRAMNRHADI